jgi:hypothetical protein
MRYNLVHIRDTNTINAVEQCISLLQRCAKLRRVSIKCQASSFAKEFGKERLAAIIRHCASHADVIVRMHVPYWSQADPDFVRLGLSYLWRLRGDGCLMKRLAQITLCTYLSSRESEVLTINTNVPLNFRFCPWEDEFSLQLFAQACRKRPMLCLPSTEAALGNLESLVRDWVSSGL